MPDRTDRISKLSRSGENGKGEHRGSSADSSGETVLTELAQILDALPDVDRYRIEAIKQSLARGDYRIDTGMVARKLIDFEKAFASA